MKISGMKIKEKKAMMKRERFSDYLPYVYYDAEEGCYVTQDEQFGYIWEISPVPFAGDTVIDALKGLLATDFPEGTCVQYSMLADPFIGSILDDYANLKTRDDDLILDNVAHFRAHLEKSKTGMKQLNGIPLRNFRVFISVKSSEPLSPDVVSAFGEGIAQFSSKPVLPDTSDGLLNLLRRLFGKLDSFSTGNMDETRPLARQIINPGDPVLRDGKEMRIGAQWARCLTPMVNPKHVFPLRMNKIFGGVMGVENDANQINAGFLYTVNIYYDDVKTMLQAKTQMTLAQKASGTIAVKIARMAEEMLQASDQIESERYLRVMPMLWIFSEDRQTCRDAVSRAKRLFQVEGFEMQEESLLLPTMLLLALPFGSYLDQKDKISLDRDFIMPVSTAALFVPIQADVASVSKPVQLLVGRKGQLIGLDLFDPCLNNYNFLVAAESGAGKSFLLNSVLFQNYSNGSKVRIIDIGGSYKRSCELFNGRFIDVGSDAVQIVLNPFDMSKAKDEEDYAMDIESASAVLQMMVTSASKSSLSEEQVNLLKAATRYVYTSGRNVEGIDAAQEFLATYPALAPEIHDQYRELLGKPARALAFNLESFSSKGEYGSYFNGPSTLNISSDDFVVLELDNLRNMPQLFSVIGLQVLNIITQDLYLSDRGTQRFILFEEAAALIKESMGGDNARLFASVIEAGFRRARKYRGSMGVVLQSVADIKGFGDVGPVLWENASTKLLLQGKAYRKAAQDGDIEYSGFALDLLSSVKNNRPSYSEVFIHSPLMMGVGRLVVDPHTYWIFTSEGSEVARYDQLIKAGAAPYEAINILVENKEAEFYQKVRTAQQALSDDPYAGESYAAE